jgi:hypothetical protein
MKHVLAHIVKCASFVLIVFAMTSAASADEDGWVVLFDGADLSAFDNGRGEAPNPGWVVKDGAVTREKPAGYIWTKEQFGDFILEVEFKTEGNSGVFFRTGDPRDCVQTGFEMQVNKPGGPNKHSVGALYDAVPPSKNAGVDGWNKAIITCKGPMITIELNGEKVVEADLDKWTTPNQNPDGSKNKYRTALKDFPRKGHIGFQEHGAIVSYRNIRVKPL